MTKRNARSGAVLGALAAVAGLIFAGCEGGPATPSDPPQTQAGLEWRLIRQGGGFTSPDGHTGQSLQDVAWGADKFVAVGTRGTVLHSPDGDRWTAAEPIAQLVRTLSVPSLRNGERFVAVGSGGRIVYSNDGDRLDESERHCHLERWLHSVAWGG